MRKLFKTALTLVLALVLGLTCLSLVACGGEEEDNTLTVGLECGYAPFNFTQTDDANGAVKISNAEGYANGYDVMIAKKIAEALGKELVIVKYEWDALLPAVVAGSLDFIIAGMSPTAERMEAIDFSEAYYESQLVIVVRKDGNFANATALEDFDGAKIVAQNGTFHDQALEAQAEEFGIIRQTPMDTFPLMINALNTKAIDGYVAEEPGAVADCAANADLTYIQLVNNVTGFTASAEDVQIAVGMQKNSALKASVNAALANISAAERLALMAQATEYATGNNVA